MSHTEIAVRAAKERRERNLPLEEQIAILSARINQLVQKNEVARARRGARKAAQK